MAVPVPPGESLRELGCRPRTRESIFTSLAEVRALGSTPRGGVIIYSPLPRPSPSSPPLLLLFSPILSHFSHVLSEEDCSSALAYARARARAFLIVCPSCLSVRPSARPPLETSSLNSTCRLLVGPVHAVICRARSLSNSALLLCPFPPR